MIVTQEMLVEMYNEIQNLKRKNANLENDKNMLINELSRIKINIKEISDILKDDLYKVFFSEDLTNEK